MCSSRFSLKPNRLNSSKIVVKIFSLTSPSPKELITLLEYLYQYFVKKRNQNVYFIKSKIKKFGENFIFLNLYIVETKQHFYTNTNNSNCSNC